MLLYLIEKGTDIFPILREYFTESILEPFSNYVRNIVPDIGMSTFTQRTFAEATEKMKAILW